MTDQPTPEQLEAWSTERDRTDAEMAPHNLGGADAVANGIRRELALLKTHERNYREAGDVAMVARIRAAIEQLEGVLTRAGLKP